MDNSRRNVVKGAALGGLFATGLSACERTPTQAEAQEAPVSNKISETTIAEAEKLQGITYTSSERKMMLDGLEQNLESLARLRATDLPNQSAPALTFDPKLRSHKVGSQKNSLTLAARAPRPFPDTESDVVFASVVDQGRWLRNGKVTSLQLTEMYLRRIEKFKGELNCYITVTAEKALEEAAKADKAFQAGKDKGPLHGIPYGLKDLADTKGDLTTWGATPYKDRIAESDCEVARKLQRAGAVLLGKTSCGALAYGDLWFDARTKNPWNKNEGSSGSSAGSASATAAGLCSFSIGTETLGSIVSPSARCGTAGLRPTFGRVSRAGFMSLCWSLDKVGPICRYVEDTALVLSEINGYDADDFSTARVGFTYDGSDLSNMRVGYVPAWFEKGDQQDKAVLDKVRALGVTLEEFSFPEISIDSLIQIVLVEAAAAFSDLTLSNEDDQLVWQDVDAWPNTFRQARFVSAVDYVQMDRLRRKLMEEMSSAFAGFDALIGPHFAGGALLATNCTGHPQLVVKTGFSQTPTRAPNGSAPTVEVVETFRTPHSISLWGDIFQEGKIIALGAALERELGIAEQIPPGF